MRFYGIRGCLVSSFRHETALEYFSGDPHIYRHVSTSHGNIGGKTNASIHPGMMKDPIRVYSEGMKGRRDGLTVCLYTR